MALSKAASARSLLHSAPGGPMMMMQDSISMLGGRQTLKVDVLGRALAAYFGVDGISLKGNDIHILAAPPKREGAVKAYFSGAMDAIIDDYKFSLVVRQSARTAGVTLLREDGTELAAIPLVDVDAIMGILKELWPETAAAVEPSSSLKEAASP